MTPRQQRFELLSALVIAASVVLFTIETMPEFKDSSLIFYMELAITSFFILEYGVRIYYAPSRWAYMTSFFGIIDLLSIAPFLLTIGLVDLRSTRVLRLLRVLRLFKVARYSRALKLLRESFKEIRTELVVFVLFTLMITYLISVGIYHFEHQVQPDKFGSVPQSMWWTIVTLTTVGYGDVFPITVGGKIFTGFILFVGLGIVSIPSGLIAASLTKTIKDTQQEPR